MTKKESLIYLAGFIDGEGCFTTSRAKYSISPRITINNTNYDILYWIELTFRGKIYNVKRDRKPTQKIDYIWIITCRNAISLTKEILPYLRVKKTEAKKLLQFENASKEVREILAKELSELKH